MRSSLFSFLRPSAAPGQGSKDAGTGANGSGALPDSLEESASYKQTPAKGQTFPLHTSREVSSIPRGDFKPDHQAVAAPVAGLPPPASEDGASSSPETWVYPSEQQYYNAVKRKGWSNVQASDIPSVVRVHNFVNERTWEEVKRWEGYNEKMCKASSSSSSSSSSPSPPPSSASRSTSSPPPSSSPPFWPSTTTSASGYSPPTLLRFLGRPTSPSPKSLLLRFMGYTAPFDRHDWIVLRTRPPLPHERLYLGEGAMVREECRYVVDFYQGGGGGCYVDARPAVDGVAQVLERVWMRK